MTNKKILILLFSITIFGTVFAKVWVQNASDHDIILEYSYTDAKGDNSVTIGPLESCRKKSICKTKTSERDWAIMRKNWYTLKVKNDDGHYSTVIDKQKDETAGNKEIVVTRNIDTNDFVIDVSSGGI